MKKFLKLSPIYFSDNPKSVLLTNKRIFLFLLKLGNDTFIEYFTFYIIVFLSLFLLAAGDFFDT